MFDKAIEGPFTEIELARGLLHCEQAVAVLSLCQERNQLVRIRPLKDVSALIADRLAGKAGGGVGVFALAALHSVSLAHNMKACAFVRGLTSGLSGLDLV